MSHKVFCQSEALCHSLSCAPWFVQAWLFFNHPYVIHYILVLIYKHEIWMLCLMAKCSLQKYSQPNVFPSPFSVHGSAVKCIKSVFLERSMRREPLELFWQNRTASIKTWTPVMLIHFRRKRMLKLLKAGPFLWDGHLPTRFHLCLSVSSKNASLRAAVNVWYQKVV